MLPNIPCPICSHPAQPFDVVDFNKSCEEGRGIFLPLSGMAVYYYYCSECGFCFAPELHRWSPEEFRAKIYNADYSKVDPDIDLRPIENARVYAQMFGELGRTLRHLDYGSGNGLFSAELAKHGWQSQNLDPYLVSNSVRPQGLFDLITANEVFEHAANLDELMGNLQSLLHTETSVVMFSTLLSDGQINPGHRLDWWYAAPRNGHISLFSSKSLALLGARYGFTLHSIEATHIFFRQKPEWLQIE